MTDAEIAKALRGGERARFRELRLSEKRLERGIDELNKLRSRFGQHEHFSLVENHNRKMLLGINEELSALKSKANQASRGR